jgi:hypothetical protein
VDSGVSNTTGISVTESVISSKSENKQIKHSESTNNQDPIESKTPQLYWNLSCPLEQSMFSGSHMEGEYLTRATKAHEIAKEALSRVEDMDWNSLENRRIFFVGDSLLRQVFISMACLSWIESPITPCLGTKNDPFEQVSQIPLEVDPTPSLKRAEFKCEGTLS